MVPPPPQVFADPRADGGDPRRCESRLRRKQPQRSSPAMWTRPHELVRTPSRSCSASLRPRSKRYVLPRRSSVGYARRQGNSSASEPAISSNSALTDHALTRCNTGSTVLSISEEGLLSRSRATRRRWARGRAKAGGLVPRRASSRGSALELLQVLPKPVDGPLFRQPDIVMQALNIGDDVAREHEQLFPGLGHMIQGVHPLF